MAWFLTSFAVGEDYITELRGMLASFRKHHPDIPAIVAENPIPPGEWGKITCYKASWLARVWEQWSHLGDMMWLDADARVRRPITPPSGSFVVAAKRYTNRALPGVQYMCGHVPHDPEGRISTGTCWFKEGCYELLKHWEHLSGDVAFDEISFTQACRDLRIDCAELPDKMTSPCSLVVDGYAGTLWIDSDIVHWNMSRKVVGPLSEWPPPEEKRP